MSGKEVEVDIDDDDSWYIRDAKNSKLQWSEKDKAHIELNRYLLTNFLGPLRDLCGDQFPPLQDKYTDLKWALFSPMGPGRNMDILKTKLLAPWFLHRKKLQQKDRTFITHGGLVELFKDIDLRKLLAHVEKMDADGLEEHQKSGSKEPYESNMENIWGHLLHLQTLLFKILKLECTTYGEKSDALAPLSGIDPKQRESILKLAENKDILELVLAAERKRKGAPAAATKTEKAADTSKKSDTKTTQIPPAQHKTQPKAAPSAPKKQTKQQEEEEDDEDEGEGEGEGDEDEDNDEDRAEMQASFQKAVGQLVQGDGIKELLAMGAEQMKLEKEGGGKVQQMTKEEAEKASKAQADKCQGIMAKLATGLFDMTDAISGKKKSQKTSNHERQEVISRFQHVLGKITGLQMDAHQKHEYVLEDLDIEMEEKKALADHEQLQRVDILRHFHQELMKFVDLIYTTRAKPGRQQYLAAKTKEDRETYLPFAKLYELCEQFYDTLDANVLTPTFLDELYKIHENKVLRQALRKNDGRLFLGACTKKAKPSQQNEVFREIWKASPDLAAILVDIRVDTLYRTYEKFPKNLKVVWQGVRTVMRFVAILSQLKDGKSLAEMRPIIMSVMAVNNLTPDQRKDPEVVSQLIQNVIRKFGTQNHLQRLRKTCASVMEKGDVMSPLALISEMVPDEMADSFGMMDEDDDDEDANKKDEKDTKKDAKGMDIKKLMQFGKMMFGGAASPTGDTKDAPAAATNPWEQMMTMFDQFGKKEDNNNKKDQPAPAASSANESMPPQASPAASPPKPKKKATSSAPAPKKAQKKKKKSAKK